MVNAEAAEAGQPRKTCYQCFRPKVLCVCDACQRVSNRTLVTVVQHPRERFHALNTVTIAEQSLERVRVLRGQMEALEEKLRHAPPAPSSVLLFPTQDAVDIGELESPPDEIVVVDGTWSQAKVLLRDLPSLQELRKVRFTPPAPSEYRIRKEPKRDYISTIETIVLVLGALEPETVGVDGMQETFRSMIDSNIAHRRPKTEPRERFRGRSAQHRFPRVLREIAGDLVVAYGEGSLPEQGALERSKKEREPLLVLLERVSTGERIRVLVKPEDRPAQKLLDELGLSLCEVQNGATPCDGAARIQEFLGEHGTVATWNASSLSVLEELGVRTGATVQLKAVYCNWRRFLQSRGSVGTSADGWGSLTDVMRRHGLPESKVLKGRGERRLEQTRKVLDWLAGKAY